MGADIITEVVGSQQPDYPRLLTTSVVGSSPMTWHDLIREGRAKTGESQKALGRRIGVSQALIAKIEGGVVQSSEHLQALIDALELDATQFPEGAFGDGRPRQAQTQSQAVPAYARDPAYWAAAAGLVGEVPLFASAEGGEGSLIIEREPIGSVKRPPLLQGVKDGYAIYLVGESMVPEFEPGDTLMINPRLPALPGASCLFVSSSEEGSIASVKRFLGSTDAEWRVKQYNPDRTFTLDRDRWPTRHRIVSKNFRS